MWRLYTVNLLCLISLFPTYSQFQGFQEIPDSLLTKTYSELYNEFYNTYSGDVDYSKVVSTAFIKKAYLDRDTIQITNGYFMMTYFEDSNYLELNDSLIKYAEYLNQDFADEFSWYAYQNKGNYYFEKRDFKKSFNNHIKALDLGRLLEDKNLQNISTTNLGLLMERTGRNAEALNYFFENYKYESNKFKRSGNKDSTTLKTYLNSVCLLANSYRLNQKYDSAQYYNKKVFEFQNHIDSERYLGNSGINSSEVHFEKEEFKIAIDSLDKAIPLTLKHDNIVNAAVGYCIRGLSYERLEDYQSALANLKKMDSIFNIKNDLHPSLRPGYNFLIKYYKEAKQPKQQLYYVEQLLKFDSIVYDFKLHIADGLHLNERKKLLLSQQKLKEDLNVVNNKSLTYFIVSLILIGFLVFEIIRRKKRNNRLLKEYQDKFDNLIQAKPSIKGKSEINEIKQSSKLKISESVINEIKHEIKKFESEKGYLKKGISSNKMANQLGTNSNYLSQIIKHEYGISFRDYINSLRINYILKSMRNNRRLVNYSVHAIAREAGYNRAEPFSKAFKNRTGMYPSEFIAQIKSEKNTNNSKS